MMERVSEDKLKALRLQPGASQLLSAIGEVKGAYLVGGAVRDLMLGFAQFDFDLAYEGDASELATFLATELGGKVTVHERFNTATLMIGDGVPIDIAGTRTETYERPGALPTVAASDIANDLGRRDFSVNAMAMALWRRELGRLEMVPGATADLIARLLRVLHDASFEDDPTRLLRLVRYGARLGFAAEPHTEDLARCAVSSGALSNVSRARVGNELLDLLGERSAVVAIDAIAALELDRAIHPRFVADEYVAARASLTGDDGLRQDLVLLAVCCRGMEVDELGEFLSELALNATDRDTTIDAVVNAQAVAKAAEDAQRPSELAAAMRGRRPETAALAAALPETDPQTRRALHEWLDLRAKEHLLISGGDLRKAGIAEGPSIGRALAETLDRALDGELTNRESQLAFALERARSLHHDHVED